ncbi:MAG: SIS domain-containing protein [Scrofimicrobium sp.]
MSEEISAKSFATSNAQEVRLAVDAVDPTELGTLADLIQSASRVFFTGAGRSGLMAKAIAMRLMHTGLTSYAVGEIATPAIGPGDLLVAITARGSGSVRNQLEKARSAGSMTALVTVEPDPLVEAESSATVHIPVRLEVPTVQHAGSLFEQTSLVIGDAVARLVQERLSVPTEQLNARHANLS